MTTIIRRYRRQHPARIFPALVAVVLLLVLVAGVLMILWKKGGPQPVHEIVIAIPAPQMPAGRRT